MKTSEVFERAIRAIEQQGWYQGSWCSPEGGGICAETALRLGAGMELHLASDGGVNFNIDSFGPNAHAWDHYIRAADKLEQDLPPELQTVPAWNDDPNTTVEDVILKFKERAAYWAAQGD